MNFIKKIFGNGSMPKPKLLVGTFPYQNQFSKHPNHGMEFILVKELRLSHFSMSSRKIQRKINQLNESMEKKLLSHGFNLGYGVQIRIHEEHLNNFWRPRLIRIEMTCKGSLDHRRQEV